MNLEPKLMKHRSKKDLHHTSECPKSKTCQVFLHVAHLKATLLENHMNLWRLSAQVLLRDSSL